MKLPNVFATDTSLFPAIGIFLLAATAIGERRRTLQYRNLLVRQMVQMKKKIGMPLMEAGMNRKVE